MSHAHPALPSDNLVLPFPLLAASIHKQAEPGTDYRSPKRLPVCVQASQPPLAPKLICNALGPPGHPHAHEGCTYGSMLTGVASPITERTGGVTSELSMDKEHIDK